MKLPFDFIILELGGKPYHLKGRERGRMLVRLRDQFKCRGCGAQRTIRQALKLRAKGESAKLFDVHHLDGLCGKKSTGYDSPKNISRLITLCHKCHYNHHEFSQNTAEAKLGKRQVITVRDKQIIDMHRSGLRNKEIAGKIGKSRSLIGLVLSAHGLKGHRRPKIMIQCKCGRTFQAKYPTRKYCSAKCAGNSRLNLTPEERIHHARAKARAWYLKHKGTPALKAVTKQRNKGLKGVSINQFRKSVL